VVYSPEKPETGELGNVFAEINRKSEKNF